MLELFGPYKLAVSYILEFKIHAGVSWWKSLSYPFALMSSIHSQSAANAAPIATPRATGFIDREKPG